MDSYGNSVEEQYYQYRHSNANAGLNYYRLWQYDLDGTHANLGLVEVKLESNDQVRLYPNPVHSGQSIQLVGLDISENPQCTLHNWVGQSWPLIAGPNGLNIPADLPAGMYFLKIATATATAPTPVQIQ